MEEPAPQAESTQAPAGVTCPNCGHVIDPTLMTSSIAQCPECKTEFFLGAEDEPADTDESADDESLPADQEMSALRIKQFATLRRTAYRTRSYLIIATLGCLWVTIPLIMGAVSNYREEHHWSIVSTLYALCTAAALLGAFKFAARTIEVQRGIKADIRARELEELEAGKFEPDLSKLSDGSQYAKLLDQMTGGSGLPTNELTDHEELQE